MKLEEVEALDLKPGQRIQLTLNTSIGPDKYPLPDNETYTQMVSYQGLIKSEFDTGILVYHEATGGSLNRRPPIEVRKMLPLIEKISFVEVI